MTRIRETASKVHGLCVIRLIRVIGGDVNEGRGGGDRIAITGTSSRNWSPLGGPIEWTGRVEDSTPRPRTSRGGVS